MTKTILGVFTERSDAEEAIDLLKAEGFNPKDISIIMKNREEGAALADDTDASVAEGAVSGATTGAVLGGVAGLLASIALPGVGAFLVGGPIAAYLGLTGAAAATVSGAATGALAGGLLGALMNLGLTEEEARTYEEHIEEGAILLAIPAQSGQEDIVEDILADTNAQDIRTVSAQKEDRFVERTVSSERSSQIGQGQRAYAYAGTRGGRSSTKSKESGKSKKRKSI